ncbi:hypothetical protein ACRAWD_22790 [Caulobacter segnis]
MFIAPSPFAEVSPWWRGLAGPSPGVPRLGGALRGSGRPETA